MCAPCRTLARRRSPPPPTSAQVMQQLRDLQRTASRLFWTDSEAPDAKIVDGVSLALRQLVHVLDDGQRPGRDIYIDFQPQADGEVRLCLYTAPVPYGRALPPAPPANDVPASAAPGDEVLSVAFHSETIEVIRRDGQGWLPLRALCERFGVDTSGQMAKLKKCAWVSMEKISMQVPGDDQAREVVCLSLRSLAGWLFSIKPGKIAPELREGLVRWQREAAEVLYRHLFAQPVGALP